MVQWVLRAVEDRISEKVGSLASGNRLFVLPSSLSHALAIFLYILLDPSHCLLPEGRMGQVDVEVLLCQFFVFI
jgi:hypothetical protein